MTMEWSLDEEDLVDQLTVGQLKFLRRLMIRTNRPKITIQRERIERELEERGEQ